MNFHKQKLQRLKDYQKNNKPQRRKPGNTGSSQPIKFNVSGSPNSSNQLDSPEPNHNNSPSPNNHLPLILGIGGGVIALLLLIIIILLVKKNPRHD